MMQHVVRTVAACALLVAITGSAARAADPMMTLRVAVNVSALPNPASKYMVNCVVYSSGGQIAQGSATGDLAHSQTPAGTYVGGFNGTVPVPLYQVGPAASGPMSYSCSLLIVSTTNAICSASDACASAGGVQSWVQHRPSTPFTPTIGGPLPAPSAN